MVQNGKDFTPAQLTVGAIDEAHEATADEFVESAKKIRDDREAEGVGDRYGCMQQTSAPAVDEHLIDKQRLEVRCQYDLDEGGTELRW